MEGISYMDSVELQDREVLTIMNINLLDPQSKIEQFLLNLIQLTEERVERWPQT